LTQLYEVTVVTWKDAPSSHTFYNWNAVGHKFAAIAGGGSIYALVIIVGLDLRWTVSKLVG
jgi:hypothetical protein